MSQEVESLTTDQPVPCPLVHWIGDVCERSRRLFQVLEARGYRVRRFAALSDFRLGYAVEESPAAVVMDVAESGNDTACAQVVAEIKAEEATLPPVLFLSARDNLDIQLMAYRVGVSCYLTHPVDADRLAELLDELTGRTPVSPYRVMAVCADLPLLQTLTDELRRAGIALYGLNDPLQFFDAVRSFTPDVLLVDGYLPGVSGAELATVLRGQDTYAYLPIVFLVARHDLDQQELALTQGERMIVGGDDFLVKPVSAARLVAVLTARARRTRQMIRAKEVAERANQAKSDFLSNMSHELRTPMNAILGFAQFLEVHGKLDAEQKESVAEILKAGRHLLELINEVLDLAKIESGRLNMSLESVTLPSLIEECFDLVYPLAVAHGIFLRSGGLMDAAVRADRTKLKQVLINLFANAIKYNLKGGSVRLGIQQAGPEHLRIMVSDTGLGISQERSKLLFQPFNRLGAENSNIEGSGIGLTITRKLVEMMGGRIGFESRVGFGSTFWIELPVATPGGTESRGTEEQPVLLGQNERRYSILYIEDNLANLRLVSQIVGQYSHLTLLTAHTPELGVEMAATRLPDLILLDINLPGLDGYQVLEILRGDEQLRNIPVIAVTAYAMPHDIDRGMSAGFSGYLTKPLDIGLFIETIEHWLYHRETAPFG